MSAIADLHIITYDIVFAKDGHVLLRYSAEGSHCGEPHNGIDPSGKKAKWTAAAIFEVKDGKVHSFTKEWDKLNMWKQLGWVRIAPRITSVLIWILSELRSNANSCLEAAGLLIGILS